MQYIKDDHSQKAAEKSSEFQRRIRNDLAIEDTRIQNVNLEEILY